MDVVVEALDGLRLVGDLGAELDARGAGGELWVVDVDAEALAVVEGAGLEAEGADAHGRVVDDEQVVVLDEELGKFEVLVGLRVDAAVETDAAVAELREVDKGPAGREVGVEVEAVDVVVGVVAQEEAGEVDVGNTARGVLLGTDGKSVIVCGDILHLDRAATTHRDDREDC